eukprot:123731-Rhodomonas_salina.1
MVSVLLAQSLQRPTRANRGTVDALWVRRGVYGGILDRILSNWLASTVLRVEFYSTLAET